MTNSKRNKRRKTFQGDLQSKISRDGGPTGFSLLDNNEGSTQPSRKLPRTRLFPNNVTQRSEFSDTPRTAASRRSRYSRAPAAAVHVVCAVSENLARETAVASLDAAAPTAVQIAKQANGQTYAETITYLDMIVPDEILMNEGRRNSPLTKKILQVFENRETADGHVVVKFISRNNFDQTRGAELLRKIARSYADVVTDYIYLSAAHAVLQYTQCSLGATFAKNSVSLFHASGHHRLSLDRSTMKQLELLVNAKTHRSKDSLLGTIDATQTTVGGRLLRTNLMSPPAYRATVETRLELVEVFLGNADLFYAVLEQLAALPDLDKMLANVALEPKPQQDYNERKASRGISALVSVQSTLAALPPLAALLEDELRKHVNLDDTGPIQGLETPHSEDDHSQRTERSHLGIGLGDGSTAQGVQRLHLLRAIWTTLKQPALSTVQEAVSDVFTASTAFSRNSHVMRHKECFALKCSETDLMTILRQAFLSNVDDIYKKADEYAEIHNIPVHVRHSVQRGYYLAIPAANATNLPNTFLQASKTNRFITCTTEEISSLNSRASDNMHDLLLMTHDRIQEVMSVARDHYDALAAVSDAVALLDMCHSFADHVTLSQQIWCRPVVTDDPSSSLMIRGGRFAIATKSAQGTPTDYIANDTYATPKKPFTIITGINGSGKSTYLHQIAMIVILAQCGSYVPADQACIPIREQLCCRMGNTDDQEHNISTFLLEMKETAFICNTANERSLVLVDELGRATSNEDGVAMAWAFSEYLLKRKSMTFFVTHYPQLSRLRDIYPHAVQNVHLASTIQQAAGEIHYSHKLHAGACPVAKDYGVELAAACGWPDEVFQDASNVHRIVEELLPDDRVCENSSQSTTVNHAFRSIEFIDIELKSLASGEHLLSIAGLREKLLKLQETVYQGCDDHESLPQAVRRLLLDGDGEVQQPLSRKSQASDRDDKSEATASESDDSSISSSSSESSISSEDSSRKD